MDYSALGNGHEFGGHHHLKADANVGTWETNPYGGAAGIKMRQEDQDHTKQHTKHEQRRRDDKPRVSAFDVATDIVGVALPLGLLGFLGAVLNLDGREADDKTLGRWQNAISILATLFPMFFATVVGRMVFELARWKLERGSSLGALEQLLGSRTFGGALITQLHLPGFNLLGLLLVLTWAFSPLGAQSYLRILESPFESAVSHTECLYRDLRKRTGLARADTNLISAGAAKVINARFKYIGTLLATLLQLNADMQSDTMDIWGNVKIPFLVPGQGNGGEWRDVVWSADLERFSGLAGVPLTSVPVSNSTIDIEAAYLDLSCSNISTFDEFLSQHVGFEWDWPNLWTMPGPPERGNGSWQGISTNRTAETVGMASNIGDANWGLALDRFVDYMWANQSEQRTRRGISTWDEEDEQARSDLEAVEQSPAVLVNETGIDAGPTRLWFEAYIDSNAMSRGYKLGAFCDVKQRYVENRVLCRRTEETTRQNCTVIAQRPSQRDNNPSEDLSALNFPEVFLHLATRLPVATNMGLGNADLAIQWLDTMAISGIMNNNRMEQFQDIDDVSFGRRLSQLLNTYLTLTSFDLGAAAVSIEGGAKAGARSFLQIEPNSTASVEVSQLVLTYRVNTLWVTLAFVCCGVLLAGGALGIVFAHWARGPEVLGFASSVIRDSKLMDMPPHVGRMSGVEITREMRDMRVRYGYSELTMQGQPLMGVGREHEMGRL